MTHSTHLHSLLRLILALAGGALIAGLVALGASEASHAQSGCPLPARLQIGDPVEVIDGTANTLRYGPGLGYAKMHLRIVPGDVWIVQDGPVCADGIHWYNVGAYDAGGWTAEGVPGQGYYLARTSRPFGEDLGSTPVCVSNRLSAGMRVMVGDSKNQRVRPQPSRAAREIAWLAPRVPVTLLDGPLCADGWIWWYIGDDTGRIQGWTAEGDGRTPWLVPVAAGGPGGSPGGAAGTTPTLGASATRSIFTGSVATSWTLTPANHAVLFSPDQEAVTVTFSDFVVRPAAGATQARRTESLTLPVRSGPRGTTATATVLGTVDCSNGGRATLTLQVGAVARIVTCQDADTGQVTVQTTQPANADLRIFITAQVWGVGAQPSVTVDLLDIGLAPR